MKYRRAVFRIREILRRIRILGSVQKITGTVRILLFPSMAFTKLKKLLFFLHFFCFFTYLRPINISQQRWKVIEKSPTVFKLRFILICLLVDGSNRIHIRIRTNNYGSGRQKNLRSLRIRLQYSAIENDNAQRFANF